MFILDEEDEEEILCFLLKKLFRRKRKSLGICISINPKPENNMIQAAGQTDQLVKAKISPKTLAGHPAPVDGIPVWSIVSGNGTIQNVSADGLTGEVWAPDTITDPSGQEVTVAKITADADLGAGVEEISDTIEFTVTNAKAANLGLVLVEVKAKP